MKFYPWALFRPLFALSRKRIRSLSNYQNLKHVIFNKNNGKNWQYLWSFSHNSHWKSQKLRKFQNLRKNQRCCWKITLWKKFMSLIHFWNFRDFWNLRSWVKLHNLVNSELLFEIYDENYPTKKEFLCLLDNFKIFVIFEILAILEFSKPFWRKGQKYWQFFFVIFGQVDVLKKVPKMDGRALTGLIAKFLSISRPFTIPTIKITLEKN